MSFHRYPVAICIGASFALLVLPGGCKGSHKGGSASGSKADQGRQIEGYADLKPDTPPTAKADLLMAGTRIPVVLTTTRQGPEFKILLRAHNETFETESYRSGPSSFSLSEASGDLYSPDVDLVRFPMQVGDEWNWEGTVSSGKVRRRATATVKTSSTHLNDNGIPVEAIKVDVDLSLYSEGTKTPAARKLVFDFVPERGIVRREFGFASVREPAQP